MGDSENIRHVDAALSIDEMCDIVARGRKLDNFRLPQNRPDQRLLSRFSWILYPSRGRGMVTGSLF
jgi:hypothetical protein